MDAYEEAALLTLTLLESRLDRIEYVLGGRKKKTEDKPRTVPERMHKIERSLQELSAKSELLNDVQELLKKHSDLLKPVEDDEKEDAGLEMAEKAALVVERAPGFAAIASQLRALNDQQIPSTDGFTKLAKLRPRMAELENRQLQLALQISLVRRKNGLMVQRTKNIHHLGPDRCFVEYYQRIRDSERTILRGEFKQKQNEEQGVIES
ncbi:hypothetical protein BDV95DRAFT_630707 [Massariosphaeria phaeospora]|uniref:Uncharacterized protein n=1 Tax=Massariosphaeria phaeospora TaxID=100035 RepID=A0A7C8MIN6_9PLEO|nr:hypothetical protein BDV95DRAFT_630707 [Massariosphaeria phaeospora]